MTLHQIALSEWVSLFGRKVRDSSRAQQRFHDLRSVSEDRWTEGQSLIPAPLPPSIIDKEEVLAKFNC